MIEFNAGPDGDYYDVRLHARMRRLQIPRIPRPHCSINGLTRAALRLRRFIAALALLIPVVLQILAQFGYRLW